MEWAEAVNEYIQALPPIKLNHALLYKMVSLIDLTSLNETDTADRLLTFCQKAQTSLGPVAAVCVNLDFVALIRSQLTDTPVKVATVANFPRGELPLEDVLIEIEQALQEGAQEIDVVFPYLRYLAGEQQYASQFVTACRAACGNAMTLKVILETGALKDPVIIADASYDTLMAGADFIKTSTGKIAEGATLEAAATMLMVIKHASTQLKRQVGIKISGGIRTCLEAAPYMVLAELMMGPEWLNPETFRIGSSRLVDDLSTALSLC